jgi:hypothetical protein
MFGFGCLQNSSTFYTQKRSNAKDNKTGFIILKGTVHLRICMQPRAVAGSCIVCWLRGYCVAAGVRGERAD